MLLRRLNSLFYPERFQGWGKSKNYFEGWYFKILSADTKHAFAIIPGIAFDEYGNKHAFIQLLDGKKASANYTKFNANQFSASPKKFEVSINDNVFSSKQIILNLPEIKGRLNFEGNIPWPSKIFSPGIMGPFAFVPFMECYHGIVSLHHTLKGVLTVDGETIDFTNGIGYIEKDWGQSFPEAYVWMQTNHFQECKASLKLSVAKIPWLGKSFNGFIAGLWVNKQLYQFTTYNQSYLSKCKISKEIVELELHNKKNKLKIVAYRNNATTLASPINGLMDGKIEESMTSKVKVILSNSKTNDIIFEGTGEHTALEVAGKVKLLLI